MAITPHKGQIATMWAGPFTVDTLVVPCYGAVDVPLDIITGSLRPAVLSAVYASFAYTLTFAPNTLQPGQAVEVSCEIGTAPYFDVQVSAIDLVAQTLALRFENAAGAGAAPPIVGTNAKVHLLLPRAFPVR